MGMPDLDGLSIHFSSIDNDIEPYEMPPSDFKSVLDSVDIDEAVKDAPEVDLDHEHGDKKGGKFGFGFKAPKFNLGHDDHEGKDKAHEHEDDDKKKKVKKDKKDKKD